MTNESEMTNVVEIKLSDILFDDDLNEGRGKILPIDVAQLMNSIQENGLLQPVVLAVLEDEEAEKFNKKYRLVAGYRRGYSFIYLQKETIPALVRNPMSETEARLLNLSENLQRKDLNILQEARAVKRLLDLGLNRDEIAKKVNTSSGWVQIRTMLLTLQPDVQKEAATGILTQTHIRELYTINKTRGAEGVYEAVRKIKDHKAKGAKTISVNPRKDNPNIKMIRGKGEVFKMMDHLSKTVGVGLYTRTMAWAIGEISTNDLYDSVEEYALTVGKEYTRPEET